MLRINCRNLANRVSGVQRYTIEIVKRLSLEFEKIESDLLGIKGHIWEQTIPLGLSNDDLLWNPANTGPIYCRNQVVTIHDAATMDNPEWFNRRFAQWYRYLLPRLCRNSSGVITVSEYSKSRLLALSGVNKEKIKVIYNGISNEFFESRKDDCQRIEKAFKLERPFLLFVGSVEPRKNLERLMRAWERVSNPDFDLVIAGSTNSVFRQKNYQGNSKNVIFIGRVSDEYLPALYASAYAFIYPSLYEGFGLPPLEAMASGCPVATSVTASLPEVCGKAFADFSRPSDMSSIPPSFRNVVEGGIVESRDGAVVYFNPFDEDSIARGIECLLFMSDSERKVMIECAKKRSSEFNWRRAANETSGYISRFL